MKTRLTLTRAEVTLLRSCEQTIQAGLHVFYEVGKALLMIKDSRLYRQTHSTFKVYCEERWHFTARHARHHMSAYKVYEHIAKTGPAPLNESQLRPLQNLPPSQWNQAWNDAVFSAGGVDKVTAVDVAAAVEFLRPEFKRPKTIRITLRLCFVCGYSFSDEHHLKTQASGGRRFETVALCPNHHRFATILEQQIRDDCSRAEIDRFADQHFDVGFNTKLLPYLLARPYEISSALANTLDIFNEIFV